MAGVLIAPRLSLGDQPFCQTVWNLQLPQIGWPMEAERLLMTTQEVAERLGVSKSTVVNHANKGLIAYRRTGGGQRRFLRSSVKEYEDFLAMPDGPDRESALEALKRRNRGEPDPE